MRSTILVLILAAAASAQSLVEHSAAAAGGSVGGVAGKKVSDGLTAIFQKVDKQTQKAAKAPAPASQKAAPKPSDDASAPLLEVGPAVPKQRASVPPPPPPIRHAAVHKTPPLPTRVVAPPYPPARAPQPEIVQVTSAELHTVHAGMTRDDVLKLGSPAARITMFDDGHLIEIYRYQERDNMLGTVRLTDGAVSSVQVR